MTTASICASGEVSSGSLFYRARYYNPATGRFISEDPIGFTGSGTNLYGYASNNPIDLIDPSGLLDVYIWKFTGSGPNDNWGHAAIMLNDHTYISWWPGSNRTPNDSNIYEADALDPSYPRDRWSEGRDRGYDNGVDPDFVIHIDGLDENAIRSWWDKFRNTHKWKTISQNCSTTAAQALMAGGAPPAYKVLWTPSDVQQYARFVQGYESLLELLFGE